MLVPAVNRLAHDSYLISEIKKNLDNWNKNDHDLGLLQWRWRQIDWKREGILNILSACAWKGTKEVDVT